MSAPGRAPSARRIEAELVALGKPEVAVSVARYFKTGPGEYGAGDRFLGLRAQQLRRLAREHQDLPLRTVGALLRSRWHEVRLLALLVMVRAYERATAQGDPVTRDAIYDMYLANLARVNNWDLVDLSAPDIVGAHLLGSGIAPLRRLARSESVWERRVAILATLASIRAGDFGPTLAIAQLLRDDPHDLIHKAVGWMLREVGKRDRSVEERFLKGRYHAMPRTMLRYAIEKFPAPLRRRYLQGEV